VSSDLPEWFIESFAMPRLSPYLVAAVTSGVQADALYLWNLQVSEAFYGSLHCLEICLRNSLHKRLSERYGRVDWWTTAPLAPAAFVRIDKARQQALRPERHRPEPNDIVAELPFGFWVSLLNRRYDRYFWVPALYKSFPHYHGRREPLRDNLETMVLLRNRVMHHEPVHHRDLAADHAKAYRLIGYIRPEVVEWLRTFDRVPSVLASRPIRVGS
jgi:hypothetical protein